MLKKHPAIGRLVQLPAKIVSIVGFGKGYFVVKVGAKKSEKISESFMMEHGVLIPKDCHEPKKLAATQEYVNEHFKKFFEEREERAYQENILKGFKIEDEVVEGFEAIAEE
jgi:hypothetical protein